jgi:CRISPR/Cas system-associated exonuclease Cas4 (RecB family)
MMIANFFKITILAFALSVLTIATSSAQLSDPVMPVSTEIPIDGGVLGLLVGGAIYGAKKIYEHKKKK